MTETMGEWKRSCYCAEVCEGDIGKTVTLMGWAQRTRDLGSLIFIWLRDRTGIVQVTFAQERDSALFDKAWGIRAEYVIAVQGTVSARAEKDINPDLATGKIEVVVTGLKILNVSETPPFSIDSDKVSDVLRLKNRFLDLRRPEMQRALMLKNKTTRSARGFLDENGFIDIETPMLTRSTPEGARDYLVPSRVHPGKFYALPQSPQLFKQLLMISGFDRYYQITKCFRDEDLRANRQPEFQQIDMELSFVDQEDIMGIMEKLIQRVFAETIGVEVKLPLLRMPYKEAMERFGSDKPDMRFAMELTNVTSTLSGCGFKVIQDSLAAGGAVYALNVPGGAKFSRKEIDALGEYVKAYRAKGLMWAVRQENELRSPIAKFFSPETMDALLKKCNTQVGDALFIITDQEEEVAQTALGELRLEVARKLDMIPAGAYSFLWVVEFPLLEYDSEAGRYVAKHHPFTCPMDEDIPLLETDMKAVRAKAYDMVLNGQEIGGGSIRIHDQQLQQIVFKALGMSDEEAQSKFFFLLDALRYGAPPHGGMAFGLDRLVMELGGYDSIRDVIAFPKVQSASCLLTDAPSAVEELQLEELSISLREDQ